MSKVTLSAIAKAAGVGVATVDRVLNRRAPVREATRQNVLRAATALGYRDEQTRLLRGETPQKRARMGFILLSPSYSFWQPFTDAIARSAQPWLPAGESPLFHWHDIDATAQVAASLRALAQQVDVIGLVALDHPLIRHAVEEVSQQGVRVFTLFSDLSPCGHTGYIGLDNQKAGRTAGWMAANLVREQGSIGILVGDHRFNCQESCEISFRSCLREQAAGLRVLEPLKTHETIAGGYAATRELLHMSADLRLIYAPCGGIEGVLTALREVPERQITLVCHGPVAQGELALIDGTMTVMLRHPLQALADTVINTLMKSETGFQQVTVPFEIVTRENI
ncbi:LacI family transcriptional regulator [Enterobacterales bacterium CwR94]|nr:LacI family transcriptional regulator [Enterobacterales bacterium CwR94]